MKSQCAALIGIGILGGGFAPLAGAAQPFDFASTPGRLPKNVVPISYSVALVPDRKSLVIHGTESVLLEFRGPTATIQFNSLNERLRDVRFDGKPVKTVVSDDDRQLTTVTLARPAATGKHELRFAYSGKIETQPHGLFAQPYSKPDGSQGTLLSTQMEATDARRMFPCWDEPAFRAVFEIAVTVPAAWTVVSNMPVAERRVRGALATSKFKPSPLMPSYLVELTAGDLRAVSAHGAGTEFAVWAVAGHEGDGRAALANAVQILADYNDYFGVPYPLPKLDSIAVPGGFNGAMENWGAITYNEQLLLAGATSTLEDRQAIYSVEAHEMAHQWFGDLVTMGWWDDIWLNESFASWLAAKETAARNPTWNWWEHEDVSKEGAMHADARPSSHAIEQHVTDELQAQNSFDPEITYNKGEAMLRMLEAYLGEDAFRAGIRRYMQARAYSNATAADLWAALSAASGKDVPAIAAGWTEKPGFPLVKVTARCDASGARTLVMTQQRFLLTGADSTATKWRIPLQIRSGTSGRPQPMLLATDGQEAAAGRCADSLSVNADAIGFFRAQYDTATLAANTRQFADAPDGDRIALLDDQWALVASGAVPLGSYLSLVAAMGGSVDARAWQQIVGSLGTIEYAERGSNGHDAFTAFARGAIKPAADKLGWDGAADEAPDIKDLRRTLLGDLGAWGDESTVNEARRRFAAFLEDHGSVAADDQGMLLGIIARNAEAATFEQLRALAARAKDDTELQRYYGSMVAVRDPVLAAQAARIALSDALPPQAAMLRLQMVFGLAPGNPRLSWEIFSANEKRLLDPMPMIAPLLVAQYVPGVYWDAIGLDELDAWIHAHVPQEMAEAVSRGMETARFKLAEKRALVPAADAYVSARPAR